MANAATDTAGLLHVQSTQVTKKRGPKAGHKAAARAAAAAAAAAAADPYAFQCEQVQSSVSSSDSHQVSVVTAGDNELRAWHSRWRQTSLATACLAATTTKLVQFYAKLLAIHEQLFQQKQRQISGSSSSARIESVICRGLQCKNVSQA